MSLTTDDAARHEEHIACEYCGREFRTVANRGQHYKYCYRWLENEVERLEDELVALRRRREDES